jgi:SAM-dependent methyltransferase
MAHDHGHDEETAADSAAMAELLDLDAEVLSQLLADVIDLTGEFTAGQRVRLILDLGTGTGNGVVALLKRFGDADAIAIDSSAYLLHRLKAKAGELGLADRISAVEADLDAAWPATGVVDLAWASASMHHFADPAAVLTRLFAAIRPGGLLTVLELASFPRFLPHDLGTGRPGLEERCHAALADAHAAELPHLGIDWGEPLSAAGFTIEAKRMFSVELTHDLPAASHRYAQVYLRRLRSQLADRLSADDLRTLDALSADDGSGSVRRRGDLCVRAARTAWIARRP